MLWVHLLNNIHRIKVQPQLYMIKRKVKFYFCLNNQTTWRWEWRYVSLGLHETDGAWCPDCLTPSGKNSQCPQNKSGICEEENALLPPLGIKPHFLCHAACSSYTDWTLLMLCLVWRKCHRVPQGTELWWCNHFIWCFQCSSVDGKPPVCRPYHILCCRSRKNEGNS